MPAGVTMRNDYAKRARAPGGGNSTLTGASQAPHGENRKTPTHQNVRVLFFSGWLTGTVVLHYIASPYANVFEVYPPSNLATRRGVEASTLAPSHERLHYSLIVKY